MSEHSNELHCSIVTPEAQVVEAQVESVIFPAHDGLQGVLPGHAPMLCNLGSGVLRYKNHTGQDHAVYIEEGFAHICENKVTILTRKAVIPSEVVSADIQEELLKAQALPSATIEEVEARSMAIQRIKHLQQLMEN